MMIVEEAAVPSFAKEGWTRPKENAAKHPLKGADGVVVSSYRLFIRTVLISGGLKRLPRLRQLRNGVISLWRSHPFFAKKGITLDRQVRQQARFRRGPLAPTFVSPTLTLRIHPSYKSARPHS